MTSLPEQLSAASTKQLSAQIDAQLRFFQTFATQALDHASRLVALNLSASRDSVERSSHTLRQLAQATGPRDLLVLRSHAEEQVRSLFSYGRELFDITSTVRPGALRASASGTPAAPLAPAEPVGWPAAAAAPAAGTKDAAAGVADATPAAVAQAPAAAPEALVVPEALAAPEAPVAAQEPVLVEQAPVVASAAEIQAEIQAGIGDEPAPATKPKAIVRAAGKDAPKAAAAPHPMAAPVKDTDSATVTRIGTSPKRRK